VAHPLSAAPPGPDQAPATAGVVHETAAPIVSGPTSAATAASSRAGTLLAAGAAVLFGSAFIAIVVLLRSFEPLPGALWRATLGGAVLLALVLSLTRSGAAGHGAVGSPGADLGRGGGPSRRTARSNFLRIVLLGILSGPVFLVAQNLAVNDLGATVSGFVVGMYAVFAAVLGPLVARDRLEWPAIVGFLAALVGTALLSELRVERLSTLGMAAGVFGAVGYSFYLVLGRRWIPPLALRPEVIALASALLTVVVVLAWLAVTAPASIFPANVSPEAMIALVWIAFVLVAGQTMVMASVRRIPAQRSAAFLLLNPLTSAFLALVLLGERLSPPQLLGAALVVVGIAAATRAWQVIGLGRSRASAPKAV
jgi:probable blue pigment (indigoidine) exporter